MSEIFTIATLVLPSGGKIGIAPLPGRTGNLAADLRTTVGWGANCMVSMTPEAELVAAGIRDLGVAIRAAGMRWEHLPIDDYGIPDTATAAKWANFAPVLHKRLDQGDSLLLHCMGGKGRSGMIALRLLIERGENPTDALARIRAARPGAVETDAQYQWAIAAQTKPTTDLAR